jgi:peptidoglycan hydrolase-like protein with peptidoglycan-binding domain
MTARLQRTIAITGRFDAQLRNAVVDYQKGVGLPATGTVNAATWRAMHAGR